MHDTDIKSMKKKLLQLTDIEAQAFIVLNTLNIYDDSNC